MNNNKSIAILGGMGPQASSKLLEIIVSMASKKVRSDSDFPEIILDSVPVPNFISNKDNSKLALKILKSRVKRLESFNPACFAIACNTAHLILDDLQNITQVPFVSIIEEVADKVAEKNIKKVGLLATPVTIESNLYQKALIDRDIEVVVPDKSDRNRLDSIIRRVIAGKTKQADILTLINIAEKLRNKGAKGIILGCTELPLIFPKTRFKSPCFDSLEILAKGLLKESI